MSLKSLYEFGKLKKHKTTPEEIRNLFAVAERCLRDASQTNISLDLRFISAYQSALAGAEALLGCFGYKAPRDSYHYMTWEALRNIDDKYIKSKVALFNDAKQKRGNAFYEHVGVISKSEFSELLKETKIFTEYIKNKLKREFPDYSEEI